MVDENHPQTEIVIYRTEDGRTRIQCRFEDGMIWLSQAMMAELFQTTPQNVTLHLKSIFRDGELDEESTCKDYLQVRREGGRRVSRKVRHYSLPAVLAVGYRVRSPRGTQFRQWATEHLQEYLVKGFTMDDERLKDPPGPGSPDYFDELLERIRDRPIISTSYSRESATSAPARSGFTSGCGKSSLWPPITILPTPRPFPCSRSRKTNSISRRPARPLRS